jgi:hypothetical protein
MAVFVPKNLLRQPNFAALIALVWLLVALALMLQHWSATAETLLDTDDAMRLTELRAWLGHGFFSGWYNLSEPRLQPPLGYDSHWSRLIDLGLAGMLHAFRFFVDADAAERLMRAWWPLVWLLPTIGAMTSIAWRIAGREAATVALLFALIGVPAYQQFTPGRVDHHNVQIALTLLVVACIVWSDRKRWAALFAGALSGVALAIGFESMPYLIVGGAAMALRYVFDRNAGEPLRAYGLSLALSTVAMFFISVGPDHWLRYACDAIAANNAVAAVCGGLLLAAAGHFAHRHWITRILAVASAAALACAVLLLFEPRCVRGPFAMVDPAIWPIWHDQVREMQPLFRLFTVNPLTASAIAAFPAAALVAALALGFEYDMRRSFGFLATVAVFLMAAATMVVAIRGYSYAIWLGMPIVATLALRVFALLKLKNFVARLIAGLMLTPMVLSSGAITIASAAGLDDTDSFARPASRHCFRTASYEPLKPLKPGLVVTDISYGPFLLALTPHSVMAAPYHRLSSGITTSYKALAAPPDEAREVLKKIQATYVMICGPRPPDGLPEPARTASLWGQLQAGVVPPWLEPVPGTAPFAVYRVKP